jgi:siroheme synthase-like protein
VGGGAVALRKARSLARCGAEVTVVAPDVRPRLARMRGVRVRRRRFRSADLGGGTRAPWLVVAASDDEGLNRRVARACEARRLWVNAVDRPALCAFIVPAVLRRGPVTFAVSTGGASPALAKFAVGRLRRAFGPEYGTLARALRGARRRLLSLPMPRRRRFLRSVLTDRTLRRLRRSGAAALRGALGRGGGKET